MSRTTRSSHVKIVPRDLADVLHHFLPELDGDRDDTGIEPVQKAFPIVTIPIGDGDVVRAALAWNLAVELARLGAAASLVAGRGAEGSALWPAQGRGPLGSQIVFADSEDPAAVACRAQEVAAHSDTDHRSGGLVIVRARPECPDWITSEAPIDWVLLFTSPDPRDLADTLALATRVHEQGPETRIGVTVHGARRIDEAEQAFLALARSTEKELGHELRSYGLVVDDLHVYRAIVAQRPIGLTHPQSPAARSLGDVAQLLLADALETNRG